MDLLSILAIIFWCFSFGRVGGQSKNDNDLSGASTSISTTTEAYFSDMPEAIQINYIEAESLIKADNHGEVMMGVSDDRCDNGKVCLLINVCY